MNEESESVEQDLAQWLGLADDLIAAASRDHLELTARLLAMNLARYQSRFGDLPPEQTSAMREEDALDDDSARIVISGMGNLVGILSGVMHQDIETESPPH